MQMPIIVIEHLQLPIHFRLSSDFFLFRNHLPFPGLEASKSIFPHLPLLIWSIDITTITNHPLSK
jgi:hypothetical protein